MTPKYNRFNPYKILSHKETLDRIVNQEIPYPLQWVIYPSYQCNYACPHCIMKVERDFSMLSEETMEKIPYDVVKCGCKNVIFSGGGEPLTNPHTLKIAKYLRRQGVKVGMNTNGYLLTDASEIDYLRISVDAGSRETYKKIHGVDGWEKLQNNLSNLKRNELGLAYLIQPNNWQETEMFVKWAQQFKPNFIHIRPAYLDASYLSGGDKMRELIPEMEKLKAKLEAENDNVYFKVDKFDGYWNQKLYTKCRANLLKAVLCADGHFTVCQDVFIKFGDYNKQSFEDIWFGEEHKKAIEKINLETCPRCVENSYNEILENCILKDNLKMELI